MSEDVSYELQVAIVKALKASADVRRLVDGRIYDRVPMDGNGKVTAKFPYISFGPEQQIPESADCIDASDIFLQLDAWSRGVGFTEVKRIARAIKDALDGAEFDLADNACIAFSFEGRNILRDSDGLTSHAAMSFRAVVEEH